MVWLVLFIISIGVSTAVLGLTGILGGMFLLLALNGFSESQATPIIGCYGLFVLGLNVALVAFINRWVAKTWFVEAGISFGGVLLLSILVTAVWLACTASILWFR